jgi:hypothetical protein
MATPDQLALWRIQYEELHKSVETKREQFIAWSEELTMVEGRNETVEFRRCVAEIRQDLQRSREIMKKFPEAAEFADEEIENRSGKVSQLLDVASDVIVLEGQVPRKVEKLHFMLKRPLQ